jgi:lipopolysaccharide transport system ATP-binding protein
MRSVTLTGASGVPGATIRMGTDLALCVTYESERRALRPVLGLVVKNNYGVPMFGINNRIVPGYQFDTPSQAGEVTCTLRDLPLMPATYSVDLYFGDAYQDHDVIYDAVAFEVVAADVFGSGKLPGAECGSIVWPATWTYRPVKMPMAIDHA